MKDYPKTKRDSISNDRLLATVDELKLAKEFSQKDKCTFENVHHPSLVNNDPVKNNINLSKSIIITGPNAGGKSTFITSSSFLLSNLARSTFVTFSLGCSCFVVSSTTFS